MAVMFITHDMGVVAEIADEVLVMYHGKVVESGPVEHDLPRAAGRLHAHADRLGAEAGGEGRDPPGAPAARRRRRRRSSRSRNLYRCISAPANAREGGRRRVAQRAAGRDARHRRRVRLGQDHARPLPAARLSIRPRAHRLPPRRRQRRRPRHRRQADAARPAGARSA